ncbi:hypothetical protein NC651_025156 [Populus alba x Populus x berolinensis]|nr:hypothetical protein NC651_025156 [Populus alba x Populus x berolinensis]
MLEEASDENNSFLHCIRGRQQSLPQLAKRLFFSWSVSETRLYQQCPRYFKDGLATLAQWMLRVPVGNGAGNPEKK